MRVARTSLQVSSAPEATRLLSNVRFTPQSGQSADLLACPLSAKSGHNAVQQVSTGLSNIFDVFGQLSALPGRRTVNTEPLPGSLATVTSPPIMRARLRDRARPSPVPP